MENKLHHRINKMIRDLDNMRELSNTPAETHDDFFVAMDCLDSVEKLLKEKDL